MKKCENLGELKPCPFCGSTKLTVVSKHNGTHYYCGTHSFTVRCNKCYARGSTSSCKVEKGKHNDEKEARQRAIELWNTRFEYEKKIIKCNNEGT